MASTQRFELTDTPELAGNEYVARVPPGLTSTDSLLQVLDATLAFPDYFGFNWNALSDCLRDFHWLQQHTIVLVHADVPRIPRADLRVYLEVLADAVMIWQRHEQHSLRVVFPASARADELVVATVTSMRLRQAFVEVARQALADGLSLDEFVAILRAQRNQGLTQEGAYGALEALRSGAREQDEDRVLEWMDIVVGHCEPARFVWDPPLSR